MKEQILDFFFSPWGWLSLAAIAAGLEILVPGAYLIWLAMAAFGTALTVLILNLTVDGQLGVFAVWIALSLLAAWRVKSRRRDEPEPGQTLNRLSERLGGARAIVCEAISGGRGRVKLGDSEWVAEGPDLPVGSFVRVVRVDGNVLVVESIPAIPA